MLREYLPGNGRRVLDRLRARPIFSGTLIRYQWKIGESPLTTKVLHGFTLLKSPRSLHGAPNQAAGVGWWAATARRVLSDIAEDRGGCCRAP